MPVYLLDERPVFPPVEGAEDGLVAVGGDLSPERLIAAYSQGIFPWYGEEQPILWHSPDPRWLVTAESLHLPRRVRRTLRNHPYELTCDRDFAAVVRGCAEIDRDGQDGTWIHDEIVEAYGRLHERGLAHSVEVWDAGNLVGGLYGVALGSAFFGESMFSLAPDASKVAFATFAPRLFDAGVSFIDCQVHTPHLERFGALAWPRARYLSALREALRRPAVTAPWEARAW